MWGVMTAPGGGEFRGDAFMDFGAPAQCEQLLGTLFATLAVRKETCCNGVHQCLLEPRLHVDGS